MSRIVPDDEMPIITEINGEPIRDDTHIPVRADAAINPLGVINRLNVSQMIEHEINFIGQHIRYKMEELPTTQEKYDLLHEFVSSLDKDTTIAYDTVWASLSDEEKDQFIQEAIDHGIYVQQKPFWDNANIFTLEDLYTKFGIENKYQTDKVKAPLIMAEEYYLRLHQNPQSKMSARNAGVQSYLDLPTKSKEAKYGLRKIGATPVRLGEMETLNTSITGSMEPIMNILSKYSNKPEARKMLLTKLLTGNPYDPDTDFDTSEEKGNNVKATENLMQGIGIHFEIGQEEEENLVWDKIKDLTNDQVDIYLNKLQEEAENRGYKEDVFLMMNSVRKDKEQFEGLINSAFEEAQKEIKQQPLEE